MLHRLARSPWTRRVGFAAWTGGALACGYGTRKADDEQRARTLPSGFRACCESGIQLTPAQEALKPKLVEIVGAANVSFAVDQHGARLGAGEAYALVKPVTLQHAVDALQACVDADACVIPQGANTGLTGGSVPRGEALDRPTVVINMTNLTSISPIDGGERLVCLAGAGIHSALGKAAERQRESHSVLGSLFLNPTVAAGVAFGSGGTQMRKGPVYTERVLFAYVDAAGRVQLEDTLGLKPTGRAELFEMLERGTVSQADVAPHCAHRASNQHAYRHSLCQLDGAVSRCNADTSGPPPCRSEGKVLILASVHDTFPVPSRCSTLWVACKDFASAQRLRREVALASSADLPSSCEYMDADSFTAIDGAGRVLCWMLKLVGIGTTLKALWDVKLKFEALPLPLASVLPDKVLFHANGLLPSALPPPLRELSRTHDHHVLMSVGEYGTGEYERLMARLRAFQGSEGSNVAVHECSDDEAQAANYFRFAAAPAFRTWCVGHGLEGVSVDYALPKGEVGAPHVPDGATVLRMRYSHFGCNVVHEDLAFTQGVDAHDAKMALKHQVEGMGGRLPAEHGHGTEYAAPEATRHRWQAMDPLNVFNPGVGGLPLKRLYKE